MNATSVFYLRLYGFLTHLDDDIPVAIDTAEFLLVKVNVDFSESCLYRRRKNYHVYSTQFISRLFLVICSRENTLRARIPHAPVVEVLRKKYVVPCRLTLFVFHFKSRAALSLAFRDIAV